MSSRGFIELLAISQRGNTANLLSRTATDRQWSGVACRIGKHHVVVPMGEVSEVVNLPALTPVPRSKDWFQGVGNLRGRLISVCRLSDYLHIEPLPLSKPKLIVVDHADNLYGFEVDQVFGIMHFEQANFEGGYSAQDVFGDSAQGFFKDLDKNIAWHVLLLSKLLSQQDFNIASVSGA